GDDDGSADIPPAGAAFTYWLKSESKDPIKLEVLDAQGKVVRTLSSELEESPIGPEHPDWNPGSEPEADLDADAGLHRASWDFTIDGSPYIPEAMVDSGDPHVGPGALPGEYTLRLVAGGKTVTAPLRVDPDPRIKVARADQEAEVAFLLQLRDRMSEIVRLVAQLRSVRDQLETHDE